MKIFIGYLKCNNWREWLFSERNFKPAVLEGLRNLLSKLQQKITGRSIPFDKNLKGNDKKMRCNMKAPGCGTQRKSSWEFM